MFIGNVFSLSLSPLIISAFGWRSVFIIFPILTLIWGIGFALFTVSDPIEPIPAKCFQINQVEKEYVLHNRRKLRDGYVPFPWIKAMTSIPIWSLFICNFCSNWGFYVYMNWLPTYLKEGLGFNLSSAGIYSMFAYLAMFFVSTSSMIESKLFFL